MTKKRVDIDIEKLRTKTNMIGRMQEQNKSEIMQLNERIGQLKEASSAMQKKEGELEMFSKKESILLATLQPDVITKIKGQDLAVHTMNLDIESIRKLQDTTIEELKHMQRRLEAFNYARVVEINREMEIKIRDMQRFNANIEKNSRKIESMFMEFERNFVDFKEFNAMGKKLEKSFEVYAEEFESLKESVKDFVKEKDIVSLQRDLKDIKMNLKQYAKKKDVIKTKHKKRWFS